MVRGVGFEPTQAYASRFPKDLPYILDLNNPQVVPS